MLGTRQTVEKQTKMYLLMFFTHRIHHHHKFILFFPKKKKIFGAEGRNVIMMTGWCFCFSSKHNYLLSS